MSRMYLKVNYKKRGIFKRMLASVEENISFTADKNFVYEYEDVKQSIGKILTIIEKQDENSFHDVWTYIGQENDWFQEEFTKYVIYQSPADREEKLFNVVVYESLNSRNEIKVTKRKLKEMILDYYKSLWE